MVMLENPSKNVSAREYVKKYCLNENINNNNNNNNNNNAIPASVSS